jgi:hypothetical protein
MLEVKTSSKSSAFQHFVMLKSQVLPKVLLKGIPPSGFALRSFTVQPKILFKKGLSYYSIKVILLLLLLWKCKHKPILNSLGSISKKGAKLWTFLKWGGG